MKEAKGHVLVVDDILENRDLLARRLLREGHTVSMAENGLRALSMLESESFDLVLLDIMMPEMDGHQVLEQMRSHSNLRNIPVIVISALDELESVVKCIKLGADDYLSKPFNPVILRTRVQACVEKKRLRDQEIEYLTQIEREKRRADDLLRVILPERIVEELKTTNTVEPRRYEQVAVLFADIVGFTAYCDRCDPIKVHAHLQEMVYAFENLALDHEIQKIKTIGDCFMAVGGLQKPLDNAVRHCVDCGLDMIAAARSMSSGWILRIGIHTGPVVAGIVGNRQYLFDVWGDTVNTAARIEQNGQAGYVNLSKEAKILIADEYDCESIGTVLMKGKGELEVFSVLPRRAVE